MAVIDGSNGNDNLVGTTGADTITPLHGVDTVDGRGGVDTLIVDYWAVTYDPYAGAAAAGPAISNVTSVGGSFSGTIRGMGGHTVTFSNIEHLQITLDSWLDILVLDGAALALGATLTLNGYNRNDTLNADLSALASVSLQVGPNGTTSSFATLLNIETYKLNLTSAADNVTTGAGNDTLDGNGGDDLLNGGAGDDIIHGGSDHNTLLGGAGNDEIESIGIDTVDGGADSDLWRGSYGGFGANLIFEFNSATGEGSLSNGTVISGIEGVSLTTGSGDDQFEIDGTFGVSLFAGEGEDTLILTGPGYWTDLEADGVGAFRGQIGGAQIAGIEHLSYSASDADDYMEVDAGPLLAGATLLLDALGGNDRLVLDVSGFAQVSFLVSPEGILTTNIPANFLNFEAYELTLGSGSDMVATGIGDDVLDGSLGGDTLNSGAGDDLLIGGDGGDNLQGGDGNDRLYAASYSEDHELPETESDVDVLSAGAGDDYITAGFGDDVDGGTGTDTLRISFRGASVGVVADFRLLATQSSISVGGASIANIEVIGSLEGSEYDDFLAPGDNTLDFRGVYGWGGNDTIIAGFNASVIYGGEGNDAIDLTGTDPDDVFREVFGEDGDDHLIGGMYDRLFGGSGNDTIEGRGGFDQLYGEDGEDTIDGGSYQDQIYGGSGNDTIYGAGDNDYVSGEDGDDLIYGDQSSISSANELGDNNDDRLEGGAGADTIHGDLGNDIIVGGADADSMFGGLGDDEFWVDVAGDTITELADEGFDHVYTGAGVAIGVQQQRLNAYVLPDNVERMTGIGSGQGLRGNAIDNIISAGAGADYIDLRDGGADTVSSGDGRDVLYYGSALTELDFNYAGGEGGDARGDLLVIQGDYSLTLGNSALAEVEKFRLLKANNTSFGYEGGGLFNYDITTVDSNVWAGDRLVVQGGSLQMGETLRFDGSAETDGSFQIFGGRDADIIEGGSGDDHLLGRAGDDHLVGNGGNDRLRGGTGNDLLDGGEGADTFIYAALPNHATDPYTNAALESTSLDYDTILGFDFAEDRIDLPQAVSTLDQHGTGSLSTATFDADLAAALDDVLDANSAVLFAADAGDLSGQLFLVVDADGDGAYQANVDFVIHLDAPVGTAPATPDLFV